MKWFSLLFLWRTGCITVVAVADTLMKFVVITEMRVRSLKLEMK